MTFGRTSMRDPIREHWERIERWYERYSVAVEGHAELDYQEDLALVVLQNCHAARDWLLHAEPALKDDVLALFDSGELRVCASVANASKHFTLSVPRKDAAKGHPHQNVRFLPRLHVPRRDVVYFRETAEYIALRVGDTERELWNFVRG